MRPLVLVVLFLAMVLPAWASTPADGFSESDVVTGLTLPTAMVFLPDGRFLVTQLGGEILLVENGAARTLIKVPDVCSAPTTDLEIGLLGIAIHPDFPAPPRVYLYRTRGAEPCDVPAPTRVNDLFCVELVSDAISPLSLVDLLAGIRTDTGYHNGGGVRIGPDRKLYVGVGDTGLGDGGAPGASTNPYAQDLNALEGKILRLELPNGTIPADNPFVGQAGTRGEIFAYGFRNPFRFGFDPRTQKLWAGDVGQDAVEELDIVTARGDYGWPRCEGTLPDGCALPGDVPPAFTYPHAGSGLHGNAVIGGAFAGRGAFAALEGEYFFADFGDPPNTAGAIYHAQTSATRDGLATPAPVATDVEGPVDLVFGPDGALYYVAHLAGAVRRIATTLPPPACTSIADCGADLGAALPNPGTATSKPAHKVAKRLAHLDGAITTALGGAATATGKKQARLYGKARRVLGKLLAAARAANGRGRLGVPLGPIENAVNAFLAQIPG